MPLGAGPEVEDEWPMDRSESKKPVSVIIKGMKLKMISTLNPRIEKMTTVANIDVPQLIVETIIASLIQLLCTSL